MQWDNSKGYCLTSQQLRDKILHKLLLTSETNFAMNDEAEFADANLEKIIQPSSLDQKLDSELFIIDVETVGLFRPLPDKTVYRALLELPQKQRQKVTFDEKGFEIKIGFNYLIHLIEKAAVQENESLQSSQKSSFGRLFLDTRMLADYNPCFNEIQHYYKPNTPLDLWLLVQPATFNVIIYPGMSLNQLRIFEGKGAKLSATEIEEEAKKTPILYKRENGKFLSAEHIITNEGLQMHVDASGEHTSGIIGLKARHTPIPIDTKKIGQIETEAYFEPLRKKDQPKIKHGKEAYLLFSKERLSVPKHLSAELRRTSDRGLNAILHDAGFADNGFEGDLVYEVRSSESIDAPFYDGMPISTLELFRTAMVPDKIYGKKIGSNYQQQKGSKTAKFFKEIDFNLLGRNYQKLSKDVLVQDAKVLRAFRTKKEGFEIITPKTESELETAIKNGFWHVRYDCEKDNLVLQPIPYLLLFSKDRKIFSYQRAANITDYGETRLFDNHSIGVGGHVMRCDEPEFIMKNCERERDEEVEIIGKYSEPIIAGTLMNYDKPVDEVHFGIITTMIIDGSVKPKESSIKIGQMITIDELQKEQDYSKYETWSRVLIPSLNEIFEYASKKSETKKS